MRRGMCALLALVMILMSVLGGCAPQNTTQSGTQTVYYYYPRVSVLYGVPDGVISGEPHSANVSALDFTALLQDYLQGPDDASLYLLMPEKAELEEVSVDASTVTVRMNAAFAQLDGLELNITCAAIAKTLLQFEQVQTVRIQAGSAMLNGEQTLRFTEENLQLYDSSARQRELKLNLYYASLDGRYLLAYPQEVDLEQTDSLPEYLLQQLLQGPPDENAAATLPDQTEILDVNVDNRLCIVDFSQEFWTNRPESALEERIVLLSVVNTLTELDNIDAVQFLVESEPLEEYVYFDLSEPVYPDDSLLGPVRSGLNEFDASLCLPMQGHSGLFLCPTRLKVKTGGTKAEAILEALIDYSNDNAYFTRLPEDLQILSVKDTAGIYEVDFSADPLALCSTAAQRQQCLQSISLSLSMSLSTRLLRVTVNGKPLQELYPSLTELCVPDPSMLNP